MYTNNFSAMLLSIAAFVLVVPASDAAYPETISAPGLPSLKELNTTSPELYSQPAKLIKTYASNAAAYNPVCGPDPSYFTSTTTIAACYQHLYNLGRSQCVVTESTNFCEAGSTRITGNTGSVLEPTSSYCIDVASAVLWTLNNCWSDNGPTAAGSQAANGNGNLIV